MKAPRSRRAPADTLRVQAENRLRRTRREIRPVPEADAQRLVHELQVHQIELEMQNDELELRHVQGALETARNRFAELYDFAPVGYLTLDAAGVIVEANLTAARLLGVRREQLLSQKLARFITPKFQAAFYRHQQRVAGSRLKQTCELEFRRLGGGNFFGGLESVAARDGRRQRGQSLVAFGDHSARQRAEAELRASEERYRILFDRANDGILVLSAGGELVSVNESFARMHGYRAQEMLDLTLKDLDTPESFALSAPRIRRLLAGEALTFEVEHYHKDGHVFPLEVSCSLIASAGKSFIQAFHRDITGRKQTEERIAQLSHVQAILGGVNRAIVRLPNQQKLLAEICRVAVEAGGFKLAWIGLVSPDGSLRPEAKAGETDYLDGLRVVTRDEPDGHGPCGRAIRENRPVVIEDVGRDRCLAPWRERALRFGLHYVAAFPIRIADRVAGAFLVYARRAGFFNAEELSLLTQVSEDISFALTAIDGRTERERAEQSLRRSERNLADFFEQSPIGLEWLAASGTILRANPAQLDLLGFSREEYLGRHFNDFCAEPAGGIELLERLAAKETVRNLRMLRRRKDGSTRHILLDAQASWSGDQFLYSSIFSRDITDRVRLEREILEVSEREHRRIAQDLHDGLGQLLVGTAYLTNTLCRELAAKSLPEARQSARIAKVLDEAITQTRSLARGLHPVKAETNGLMAALQELASQTKKLFHVRCRFICPRPVLIEDNLVATHLFRIAQEAVTNAIKHGQPRRIEINLTETPDRIRLAVKNDGAELPAKRRKKTGMGLHIMRHRAGSVGASLAIQNEAGGGVAVICSAGKSSVGGSRHSQTATRQKD